MQIFALLDKNISSLAELLRTPIITTFNTDLSLAISTVVLFALADRTGGKNYIYKGSVELHWVQFHHVLGNFIKINFLVCFFVEVKAVALKGLLS